MPTLRQLKALSYIAQTRSFTKAAERLFITQSAISGLIKDLEEEVGLQLIQRGRIIRLTEAGEHLQRAGGRAALEVDRALNELRSPTHRTLPLLRVAAGPLSAATLVPPTIARLKADGEEMRISLIDRPVGMVADLLLAGDADVAIGSVESSLRLSSHLRATPLLSDGLSVVAARQSAVASKHSRARNTAAAAGIDWDDLTQTSLILVGRAGGQWNMLLQDQLSRREDLTIGYEVQLLATALELVRHDLGVAVLPNFATRHLDAKAFHVMPLLGTDARWNAYSIVRKNQEARVPAIGLFIDAMHQVLAADPATRDAARAAAG